MSDCPRRHDRAIGDVLRRAALLLGALAALPAAADAQYFGRNKVQYDLFDFRTLKTPHFDILYYPAESLATQDAARMAERWYVRHATTMHHEFDRRSIILYADPPDFQQTNVVEGLISQGTGGVTEGLRERVTMPFTTNYAETDHVLGHELVHVFQYDIAASTTRGGLQNLGNIPLWMIEGMAEYLSVGREDPNTAMWLRDALRRNDLPTVNQLNTDPRFFPYRFGQALWAYVGGRWTDDAVEQVYRAALRLGYERAMVEVLGVSSDSLSKMWHASIRAEYGPAIVGRTAPDSVGRRVVGQGAREGDQNISPSVSPDGRYVAFYSSRDLFGFALLVADVRTGRVVKELQGVASDAHYDQLAFIASAGSWSPDGRKLAFVVYAKGDNEIDILDIDSRHVERRIRLANVGAVNDPAWSPDGRRIAFSGSRGGISDLYVMDLQTGKARQLTEGRYAEIQPQWSPDGQSIVFVTDRGEGTDFGELRYGPMRLATMNADGSGERLLPTIGNGKHVDPQFSPDGKSLYFLSDVDGFSDIYRFSIPENAMYRVTRVATGVSGITQYSPAMSISKVTGELLFSVFNEAGYGIRALDSLAARGVPVQPAQPEVAAAVTTDSTAGVGPSVGGSNALGRNPAAAGLLPPAAALATSVVNSYLNQPLRGLPPEGTAFAVQPYRPRLRLDYLGVPAAGVTFGTYGTSLQGAVAGYFSDELNNRTISAVVQAQGELKDIGASLAYINRERRWNWLTGVSHAPWMSIASGVKDTLLNDGTVPAFQSQLLLQRQYNDEAFAAVAYPISMTRRWEFGTGYQHTSYSSELITETFVDNSLVLRRRDDVPNPPSIQLGRVNAAFVGDHSFFGFVSPVAGGRYRLEVSPVFGTLNFTTGLADYRRYMFKKPVTFAVRGLFFGRFGRNAEDSRLQPLYLGQTTLIRGYDIWNDFNGTECTQTPGSNSCPELDRLIGSRVGVASAELRLPLFGVQQFGILAVPFVPPTELSFFVEGGTAWNKDESPVFKFARRSTERIPVFSAGVSARINLFGFAVGEVFYAYPFQRPDKGAHFGFQLAPGW